MHYGLLIAALATGCATEQGPGPCVAHSILTGLAPEAAGWESAERASNGVIGPLGEPSTTSISARAAAPGAVLTWRLPDVREIRGLVIEAEGDDRVGVEVQKPDGSWSNLGAVGGVEGEGLTLHEGRFALLASALRLTTISGEPFAVGEVAAYDCVTPWPAQDLALHAGVPTRSFAQAFQFAGVGRALIAVAAVAALLAGWASGPGGVAWRVRRAVLASLCVVLACTASWTNFFGFRPLGSATHQHELFHYAVGSKYADSLSYGDLYPCALHAEMEANPTSQDEIAERPVRRMTDNARVTLAVLGVSGEYCRDRLGNNWPDFVADISHFRSGFAAVSWRELFVDHGYNASPAWSLLGRSFVGLPPFDQPEELSRLAWIDPVLAVAMLLAIGLVAGWEAVGWAALVWAGGFAWSFGYIGGAFLRFASLALLTFAGLANLSRMAFLAGLLAGLAASLRIFPIVMFAAPILALALRPASRGAATRMLLGGALGVAVAVGASAAAFGAGAWTDFFLNLTHHNDVLSWNKMGLSKLVGSGAWHAAARTLLAGACLAWLAREVRVGAGNGIPLLQAVLLPLIVLDLSSYYWIFLVAMAPVWVARPTRAAVLVGVLSLHELIVNFVELAPTWQYDLAYLMIGPIAMWAATSAEPKGSTAQST